MLSPMIMFKGTTGSNINKELNNTVVSYQKNVWIDEKLMPIWISDIWVKHTRSFLTF